MKVSSATKSEAAGNIVPVVVPTIFAVFGIFAFVLGLVRI